METHFTISATMEGLILNNPNPSLSKTIFLRTPFLHSAFRHQITPCGAQLRSFCSRSLSLSVTCKAKTSQDKKQKNASNKIVLSEAAPPLAEDSDDSGNPEAEVKSGNGSGLTKLVKRLPKRILEALSNLPLAIGEMFTIAALMALGMTHFAWFSF